MVLVHVVYIKVACIISKYFSTMGICHQAYRKIAFQSQIKKGTIIILFFQHFSFNVLWKMAASYTKIDNSKTCSRIWSLYLSLIVFNCYSLFRFINIFRFVSFRFVLFPVALQVVSNDQFTSIPTSGRQRSTVYWNPPTPSPASHGQRTKSVVVCYPLRSSCTYACVTRSCWQTADERFISGALDNKGKRGCPENIPPSELVTQ